MSGYPSAEDYILAVQQPERAFDRPDLARSTFVVHPLVQVPVPVSGTTAVVFKAMVDGRPQALRFFTREDASTRQRYTALNTWFGERGLSGDVAGCTWADDAIRIGGRRWPMVQMEWVEGNTLDQHVAELVEAGDRSSLGELAARWRDLVRRAQAARFAHGDLQHGNVLVQDDGRLRLVDFDSSWIAPFAGSAPPTEVGHRNYQPANRVWGQWMDTFPGLVVYLSLLALARDPDQWGRLNDGANLLFGHADYAPPYRTAAWDQVAQLHDPEVDRLAESLRACCLPTWTATGDLESLIAAPAPWWTRTGTFPVVIPQQTSQPTPQPTSRPTSRPEPAHSTTLPSTTGPIPPGATWAEWVQAGSTPQPRPASAPRPTPAPPAAPAVPATPAALRWYGLRTAGLAVLAFFAAAAVVTSVLAAVGLGSAAVSFGSVGGLLAILWVLIVRDRRRRALTRAGGSG